VFGGVNRGVIAFSFGVVESPDTATSATVIENKPRIRYSPDWYKRTFFANFIFVTVWWIVNKTYVIQELLAIVQGWVLHFQLTKVVFPLFVHGLILNNLQGVHLLAPIHSWQVLLSYKLFVCSCRKLLYNTRFMVIDQSIFRSIDDILIAPLGLILFYQRLRD